MEPPLEGRGLPMKLSAQEEYGLRCLLQLARAGDGDWVSVSEISEAEGLSTPYVEKLLRILSQNGLARSARGSKGGFQLAMPPDRITIGAAIRALGEILTPEHVCGQYIGNQDACVHTSSCSVRPMWAQIAAYIGAMLDGMKLSDLLETEGHVREKVASAHKAAIGEPLIRSAQITMNSRSWKE
jgi:Rrf2 family protein